METKDDIFEELLSFIIQKQAHAGQRQLDELVLRYRARWEQAEALETPPERLPSRLLSAVPSVHEVAMVFAAADRANAQVTNPDTFDRVYQDAQAFCDMAELWDRR